MSKWNLEVSWSVREEASVILTLNTHSQWRFKNYTENKFGAFHCCVWFKILWYPSIIYVLSIKVTGGCDLQYIAFLYHGSIKLKAPVRGFISQSDFSNSRFFLRLYKWPFPVSPTRTFHFTLSCRWTVEGKYLETQGQQLLTERPRQVRTRVTGFTSHWCESPMER